MHWSGAMRKMKVPFAVFPLLACLLCVAAGTHAVDEPREIMWKDLVPPVAKTFPKLTRQQALQLTDIADVRERKARGDKVNAVELEDERGAVRKLEEAGFDVEALLALRKEYMVGSKQRAQSVNASLDGQTVRMPGYVLPLEFSGKDVTEFLLVPYVGACIHTPPPPAAASCIAAMMRRAISTFFAAGVKTSLASAIWLGWIAHLPSKPSAAARCADARKPSGSLKSPNGPSIGRTPKARAATATRASA